MLSYANMFHSCIFRNYQEPDQNDSISIGFMIEYNK